MPFWPVLSHLYGLKPADVFDGDMSWDEVVAYLSGAAGWCDGRDDKTTARHIHGLIREVRTWLENAP